MKNLSLVVSHLVHLTLEERSAIREGKIIFRQGISIPTWFLPPEVTSDPVYEIAAMYRIGIFNNIRKVRVEVAKDGYDIFIPCSGRSRKFAENIFPEGGGYFEGIADGKLDIRGKKVFIGHTVSLRPACLLETKS